MATGEAAMRAADAKPGLVVAEQLDDLFIQLFTVLQDPVGEAEPDHRVAPPPVPAPMGFKALEQRLMGAEQLGQGVEKQRLAKTPRAGQKVVFALRDQAQGKAGLIDIVIAALTDLAKGLDTDGQEFSVHG